jgi:NAD+ diphosphatase
VFEAKVEVGAPDECSLRIAFCGDEILLRTEGDSPSVTLEPHELHGDPVELLPLGVLRGRRTFLAVMPEEHAPPPPWVRSPLRAALATIDPTLFSAVALAAQLAYAARHDRFCARCAAPLARVERSRARACSACGQEFYPRVSPCTIVLIHDGDRLLMTRQPRFPEGMYGLVAGFVEPGETLEACAAREAREECGIEIDEVTYAGSQPWPFPQQVMVGFTARYAGGELVIDRGELEDARWFSRSELPRLPPRLSIARSLIDGWLASKGALG